MAVAICTGVGVCRMPFVARTGAFLLAEGVPHTYGIAG
jgi:hypothetical protein